VSAGTPCATRNRRCAAPILSRLVRLAAALAVAGVTAGVLAVDAGAQPPPSVPPDAPQEQTAPPDQAFAALIDGASPVFSPFVPPEQYPIGDCTVSIGPVFDGTVVNGAPVPAHTPFWIYGGVQLVGCSTVHGTVSADVVEQYCTVSTNTADCPDVDDPAIWADATSRVSGTLLNVSDSGGQILVSLPTCSGLPDQELFRTFSHWTIDAAEYDVYSLGKVPTGSC
jgi:hypothetical protein